MEGLLIAARGLHFVAAIALTGVFAFECLVAGPALRQAGAATPNMARLRRQLGWQAWTGFVLAIGSGAAWVIAVAADMAGKPLGFPLFHAVLPVVLTRTQFGEDWLLRLGLLVLIGICLPLRRWRGIGWAALLLAALMLVSVVLAGHGAATPGVPGDLHLGADIFHLLAAGLWLGTLPPLAVLLVEARQARDGDWAAIARIAISRYSALAAACVTALLTTGIVNTWFLSGTVPALVGTGYGRLLLVKLGLFIAMLMVAAVNLLRLTPRLAHPANGIRNTFWRAVAQLQRNARLEAGLGVAILLIVGVLGILPPGSHSQPGWPFPFRLDIDALTVGSQVLLAIVAVAIGACGIAAAAAAAAGRYRRMTGLTAGLVLCAAVGWTLLGPAVERAFPTSFYASAEPYDAASIARGATAYEENCASCHGASGRGGGPAAAGLLAHPADLTAPHLFAHTDGDLFWWVSRGTEDGVMPGFAGVMNDKARWDVINFIRARAAAVQARSIGPEVTTADVFKVPDFSFETGRMQQTLRQVLEKGPVLLVLFAPPAPLSRLQQLAAAQAKFSTAGLRVLAVRLDNSPKDTREPMPPYVVEVSHDVISTLELFRATNDGGETELMLDRTGTIRCRWTRDILGAPAGPETLIVDAERVARIAEAASPHAGHTH